MKFIVSKITQIENSVLLEAVDAGHALEVYNTEYNFLETKNSEITKIIIKPIVDEINVVDETPTLVKVPPVVV